VKMCACSSSLPPEGVGLGDENGEVEDECLDGMYL